MNANTLKNATSIDEIDLNPQQRALWDSMQLQIANATTTSQILRDQGKTEAADEMASVAMGLAKIYGSYMTMLCLMECDPRELDPVDIAEVLRFQFGGGKEEMEVGEQIARSILERLASEVDWDAFERKYGWKPE